MILFSIVTAGRTGSTFLCKALDLHSSLKCDEEVFNRSRHDSGSFNFYLNRAFYRKVIARLFNRDRLLGKKWNLPMMVLCESFIRSKQKRYSSYGFKITKDQLDAYPYIAKLLQSRAKVIILRRQDQLRATFSMIKARSTGNYDLYDSSSSSYDIQRVILQLKSLQAWETSQVATYSSALQLYSEALFLDPKQQLTRVAEFLNVDTIPIDNFPQPMPLNPIETSDWVENYEAIKEAVRDII